jgi:chromatin remodeling complex protein RSC6
MERMNNKDNNELLPELQKLIGPMSGAQPRWEPDGAYLKLVEPDSELASIVGSNPMTRSELAKRLWNYIRENNLHNVSDRRIIDANDILAKILNGKKQVRVIELVKCVLEHVKQ